MDWPHILGIIGTTIAACAYLPQIKHLLQEKCSAGLSISMYSLWLISSSLLLINAVTIESRIFIIYQTVNIFAIIVIIFLAKKYQRQSCPSHTH